jgi:hypothetical protein
MNGDDFRRRADRVRTVPLEDVLLLRGAVQDRRDHAKWHTERGTLSVTGSRFMNWNVGWGGGGAIDLVMHLGRLNFHAALEWLECCAVVPPTPVAAPAPVTRGGQATSPLPSASAEGDLPPRLPRPDPRLLDHVREYLTRRRHLSPQLLEPLIHSGRLYADARGNAVFVMVRGKPNRPTGAELRGTGPSGWRGMARGSRKDLGYFWVGDSPTRQLVLCESAIDAISCFQLRGACICISTAGVRANPRWLPALLARGYQVLCGFDADKPGDTAARRMIARHPTVQRLRPPAHDWNDALSASK